MPEIDGGVQRPHVPIGHTAGQTRERAADGRLPQQRGRSNDRHGIVGRKIVAIVVERREVERVDQRARGVAGDDVHLAVRERPVDERQIHRARLRRKS